LGVRPFFSGPMVDEVALLARVQPLVLGFAGTVPDASALQSLTAEHGIDAATMTLRECLRVAPEGALGRRLEGRTLPVPRSRRAPTLVVVPTMFFREHPELGGDGALIIQVAQSFGLRAVRAPVKSLGGVGENAARLLEEMETLEGPIWVATLSKGSLEMKEALRLAAGREVLARLSGWVNISGALGGSRIVDRALRTPWHRAFWNAFLRLRGGTGRALSDMAREGSHARAALALPDHVEVVSVVALPLPCHLGAATLPYFRRLEPHGPNDGFVSYSDAVAPGAVWPVWGADHYLRTPELTRVLYALLGHVAELGGRTMALAGMR
jgi:hypothetical protein